MLPSEFILGVKQRATRWIHRVGHPLQGEDAKLGITGWGAKSLRNPVDEKCPRSRIINPQTVCPQCGGFTVRVKAGAWSRCSLWFPALFPVNSRNRWGANHEVYHVWISMIRLISVENRVFGESEPVLGSKIGTSNNIIEGSLEVKLPTIWTDEKQGRGREKRKIRKKKSRRERVRRKKMKMREKVGKPRNTVFFQWFVAPEGRKVGSLKRRVRS